MKKLWVYVLLFCLLCLMTVAVAALLLNILERKQEAAHTFEKVVELDESTVDPEVWGRNFPRQYDGYKKTSQTYRTKYGGSEAVSKIDEDPIWKRLFAGYAFGVDYREERGHAYSLSDQHETIRTKEFKQPGACLQCHAGGLKAVYEEQGGGDLQKGFEKVCAMPIQEAWKLVKHPVVCADCHDPKTMELRVTRPGFLNGIKVLKEKEGIKDYDPNTMASHQEMRTFVCAQCHVEYYFKGEGKLLTYPWHNGLKVEEIEAYYDEVGHVDWKHRETGAPVLKAQHPEFEMWSQGTHAKSGVACADCHMPYMRVGASKITDHHIRSPLTNISRACLQCHHFTEQEMLDRVELVQSRTNALLDRAEAAVEGLMDEVVAAKKEGVSEEALKPALDLHRKAQWRLDFVSAENSMGFHAPQEAARILAEAADYGRQGQLAAARARGMVPAAPEPDQQAS
ncbi:MAG: Cytochrome c-552 [Candidatus Omnitrophica bacterium]|nr:Cytochrome c-552 [Candidatus Omnitrophota bacterium]